jgi:hypothetical protein
MQITFIRAMKDFFEEKEPRSAKISITEFKELTREDKVELREELIREGYDVAPLPEPAVATV